MEGGRWANLVCKWLCHVDEMSISHVWLFVSVLELLMRHLHHYHLISIHLYAHHYLLMMMLAMLQQLLILLPSSNGTRLFSRYATAGSILAEMIARRDMKLKVVLSKAKYAHLWESKCIARSRYIDHALRKTERGRLRIYNKKPRMAKNLAIKHHHWVHIVQ
jgi:hypothetical protein